jgi:hypothetical protein
VVGVGFTIDGESHVRFHLAGVGFTIDDVQQLAILVAQDPQDRVNGHMNGEILVCDRGRHRVHEKRHVVVHHLHDGEARVVAVLVRSRVVQPEAHFARLSLFRKLEVRNGGPAHDFRRLAGHVVDWHVGKISRQEKVDLFSVAEQLRRGFGREDFFNNDV